jgi:hypothetical protein
MVLALPVTLPVLRTITYCRVLTAHASANAALLLFLLRPLLPTSAS